MRWPGGPEPGRSQCRAVPLGVQRVGASDQIPCRASPGQAATEHGGAQQADAGYPGQVAQDVQRAAAAGALIAAGAGAHLAGGTLDVLRNLAGITGIGLLCAAVLGGGLAWVGPAGYLLAGAYALYTQWHHPALTTPWLWPARPPHDLGGAACAALVFTLGVSAITLRGARDPAGEAA